MTDLSAQLDKVLDVVDELYRKYGVELDEADTAIVQAARNDFLAVRAAWPQFREHGRWWVCSDGKEFSYQWNAQQHERSLQR